LNRFPDPRHEAAVHRRGHHIAPDVTSVRVIFVIHKNEPALPGSESGLGITINCDVRVLRQHGVDAQSWVLQNFQQLCHRLENEEYKSQRPITHLVVSTPNYLLPHQFAELAQRWPEIEFIMLAHTGLAYLAIDDHGPERIRELLHLQRGTHNFKVAGNNPRFEWFGIYGVRPLLLPNLYDTSTFVDLVHHRKDHDPLRIGTFGENRPWKNQGIAAMAALSIARKLNVQLELFVNADRWPQTWGHSQARQELFDGLPWAKIHKIDWLPWSKFRQIVSTMDLCIYPSFDETFCVVAADAVAEGVPSVVTYAMEWAPRSWQAPDPADPESVATVGMAMLHNRSAAVHDGRRALTDYVAAGVQRWLFHLTQ
jgi:hypothetical protein